MFRSITGPRLARKAFDVLRIAAEPAALQVVLVVCLCVAAACSAAHAATCEEDCNSTIGDVDDVISCVEDKAGSGRAICQVNVTSGSPQISKDCYCAYGSPGTCLKQLGEACPPGIIPIWTNQGTASCGKHLYTAPEFTCLDTCRKYFLSARRDTGYGCPTRANYDLIGGTVIKPGESPWQKML